MTLQILYRLDIAGNAIPENLDEQLPVVSELLPHLTFAEDKGIDLAYLMVEGICRNIKEIDDLLDRCVENWTVDRLTLIDRNILRIAVFEMKYLDDVPCKVAINEAIEAAKEFGTEKSGKFINGVLDKVLRMIKTQGESLPGKQQKGMLFS